MFIPALHPARRSRLFGTPALLLALLALSACGDDAPASKPVKVPYWAKVSSEQIKEARKHDVPVAFENELGMRFVLIPAGTFLMGKPRVDSLFGGQRQHEETVARPFYLQVTEVTNAQYRRFVPEHVCTEREEYALEGRNQPVCRVTWNEAVAFAEWAGARLPTEREWERAARGGLAGKEYPWGDEWDSRRVSHLGDDGYKQAAPVGRFLPNGYGLYDMAGNVWEWCQDAWKPAPPSSSPPGGGLGSGFDFSSRMHGDMTEMSPEEAARWDRREAEEAKLPHRAVRGGSWMDPNVDCAQRFGLAEIRWKIGLGFRLVSPLSASKK